MRGADGSPWRGICALPAFWTGLLYDAEALAGAADLIADWTAEEHAQLRIEAPRLGLAAPFQGRPLRELALEVLALARGGLARRARLDGSGQDETHFLETLEEIARSGKTAADRLLDSYETRWQQSVDPVYVEQAY
jgi:glutamate--cysteine ligase